MSIDNSIFEELPENSELAFAKLEEAYREKMENGVTNAEHGHGVIFHKRQYINEIIAVSETLEIEEIAKWDPPDSDEDTIELFDSFYYSVQRVLISINIKYGKINRNYSVGLSEKEKEKIRHYIEQIRFSIESSGYSQDKKDAIYKILHDLMLEVDRDRTRFERVTDTIRAVARLSGDIEREGMEPWWKWVKLIFGEIDKAKENENLNILPKNEKQKQIPSTVESKEEASDLDDDIPF